MMYERNGSSRSRRDRDYEEDNLGMASGATEDEYYRNRTHRDSFPSSSSRVHREAISPRHSDRYYAEEDRSRHSRARSPYASEDRWAPREPNVPSTHATYHSSTSYSRSHDDGYGRRATTDDHYRATYQEENWHNRHAVKDRDDYHSAASSSANYNSWDRHSSTYGGTALEHDDRVGHSQAASSYGQSTSHSRSYNWRGEDDRVEVAKPVERRADGREWTRRRDDDREWGRDTRYDNRQTRDNWEPRVTYPNEPSSTTSKPMPKFAPGPNWKGDDAPTSNRSSKGSWKGKGHYERKKKDKDQSRDRAPKSNDNEFRGRDNGSQPRKSTGRSKKARKRQRSPSRTSTSRSRSRSSSISHAGQSTPKRRRRTSTSPDRASHTDRSPRKARTRDRSPSPNHTRAGEDRGRDTLRRSPREKSRSRSRSRTRSTSPGPPRQKLRRQVEDSAPPSPKRRGRSRSYSRSRSPPSSPQTSLKTNGAGAAKHRLPPSGPRVTDLMNAKFQPVQSSFTGASSSSANVAAAYSSRRNMALGEPPPGPRADTRTGPKQLGPAPSVPTGPKGMYPPTQPAGLAAANMKPSEPVPGGKTTSSGRAGFRPIGNYGKPQGSSAMKRFFPTEEEAAEEPTPTDGQEAKGGGEGFGIIPSRKASHGQSPPAIWPHPPSHTTSPKAARSNATKSPDIPKGPKYLRERDISSPPQDYQRSGLTPPSDYIPRRASGQHDSVEEDRARGEPGPTVKDVGSAPVAPPAELYQLVNQVGEGTFGKVYKAKNVVTGNLVALKRIKVEAEKDGFPVTALREIKLLQSLSHPNIIFLHEMMVSKGNVYMVFDYMEHDLTGILSQTQFSFEPAHLKSLCHQMLGGLAYLHQKGVVHRDMKGSNILVNGRGELKLADFGLARIFQKRRKNDYTNRVITLWYRPPELLLGTTVYGPEVDMWSAGTIMLELFTKKPVFQGNDEIHQLEVIYRILGTATTDRWPGLADMPWYELVKPKKIFKNYFRAAFQEYMSPAALDLAEGLLTYDPEKRLTASDALNASYFVSEDPPMALPVGLANVEGEWHELETKRERERRRRGKKEEMPSEINSQDALNGTDHQL